MDRCRLHEESGFSMVEVLVAAVVLLIGITSTFVLISSSNAGINRARAREGATNLARETLEDTRNVNYSKIGQAGWADSIMTGLSGRTGAVTSPNANTSQTTVVRRGVTYAVSTSWCSVDDSKDNFGVHAASTAWCSDSIQADTKDPQPEDLKRVSVNLSWTERGRTGSVQQVATFGAGGAALGPVLTNLQITTPTVANPTAPVITANPSSGNATFTATAAGADDVKFSIDGTEQASGVVKNSGGTWTFTWPVNTLRDGTYQISAVAVDTLGVRGQSRTLPVRLARGWPVVPANVTGGYNYVWVGGVKTLVVEGQWDASPDGSVTGYELLDGSGTVCGGSGDVSLACVDLTPPTSGSSWYYLRTWYRDASNALAYVTVPYYLTAPAQPFPATYSWTTGTSISRTNCYGGTGVVQGDAPSTFASGAQATFGKVNGNIVAGCLPPFTGAVSSTAGTGTGTFTGYFKNTGSKICYLQVGAYPNKSLATSNAVEGNAVGGSPTYMAVPKTTTPTLLTYNYNVVAKSFAAGDQLTTIVSGFSPGTLNSGDCSGTTFYYNTSTYQSSLVIPMTTGGSTPLAVPAAPTGLAPGSGGTTLTWTAPASSNPAVDFYRIYRDGTNYTNRVDTADATSTPVGTATSVGATTVTVPSTSGFAAGQSVSVDTAANQDNVTIQSVSGTTITFTTGLAHAHATGVPVGVRTISWTDTNTGGSTHTYAVTSVSAPLAESAFTPIVGPL